jgi:hypothetical protein
MVLDQSRIVDVVRESGLEIDIFVRVELMQTLICDGKDYLIACYLGNFDVQDGSVVMSLKDTSQRVNHL